MKETPSQKEFVVAALDKYERALTRYASRLMGSNDDAARDVVQHTFLKLCQQPMNKVQHKLGPWLYTVCRNRVIDEQRKKGRKFQLDEQVYEPTDPSQVDPAESAQQKDFLETLLSLVSRLPKAEREVVELWSQGLNHQEVAEVTGKNVGTIRVNLHRGIKQLKKFPQVSAWLSAGQNCNSQGTNFRKNTTPLNRSNRYEQ